MPRRKRPAPLVRPVLPRLEAMDSLPPQVALTDDLLEEIFLRVASPADLARASIACVSFRRLLADPTFLRRYRSVHPPLLLGFLNIDGFQPAEAPHPSAPVARALAGAADFSFDCLPRGKWSHSYVCDVRDGRALFEYTVDDDDRVFSDLAVCDPLSRRYLLLPRIPADQLASVELQKQNIRDHDASLVPSGDGDEETSFRVIRIAHSVKRLAVFLFSSGSGCWTVGTSTNWEALILEAQDSGFEGLLLDSRQWAYDCFYWKVNYRSRLLKLDMNIMEFSFHDLPPDHDQQSVAIVEAGEGKLAMFSKTPEGASMDYYTFLQDDSEKAHEWHMKNTIALPAGYTCCLGDPAEGYIDLVGIPKDQDREHSVYFSIDVKTFNIQRISTTRYPRYPDRYAFLYFGFPPSMSPRRIQGYEVD